MKKSFWIDEGQPYAHSRTRRSAEQSYKTLPFPGGSHCGYREVICISDPFKGAVQRADSEAGIR